MNDQRPTRWPCSADSSRNAAPEPRSFRNAETGVSQSSMNVSQTGTRLWVVSATPGKQHLLGVGEREVAGVEEDCQVVEGVGGLLGLLLDLLADVGGVGEQLGRVRGVRRGGRAGGDRPLEAGERLVRRGGLEFAVVEAGASAGVAGRPAGEDERENGVRVAVVADRLDGLGVSGRRALAPQLVARPAP